MKNSKLITSIILSVVISGTLFYYIGIKSASPTTSGVSGNLGRYYQAGGNKNGGSSGNSLVGSVIDKNSQSITVQSRDGSSKIVLVSGATRISKSVSGNLNDLSNRENVIIIGQTNSDGSITAESIQIRSKDAPNFNNQTTTTTGVNQAN